VKLARGEPGEATRILEPGLAMARAERLPLWIPPFATQLGIALARTARSADAVALLERVLQAPSDAVAFTPFAAAALAEAYLLSGRVEDAAQQVERAIERAQRKQERGYEGWALKLRGDVAATREPAAAGAAVGHYRAAIEIAAALGMRPLAAHSWLALGALHTQAGRRSEARDAYDRAIALLEAMRLPELLEKARERAA
jgi:tetratricopeptide (TPR) repeat protein